MRLRSYVALELLCGATMAAGLGVLAVWGVGVLGSELDRVAEAARLEAPPSPRSRERTPVSPHAELALPRRPAGMFRGVSDEVLLAPLESGAVTRAKLNRGGSSISLRLDFDNGARAAFKPRQINLHSVPRREIAAFRINRLLGMSSVPPAVGRAFPVAELLDKLHPESVAHRPRLEAEMITEDGVVIGEMSWWIPVLGRARLGGFEIDSIDGVVTWKRYLTVDSPIPQDEWGLVAQISDMLLFDFIINNPDRWSGGNARTSADGRILYFMDNTLSFGDDENGSFKVRGYFGHCQRFSRTLVNRLRHLDERQVRRAVSHDLGPFDELLADSEIQALLSRRDFALAYIDELIATHGADDVLVFP